MSQRIRTVTKIGKGKYYTASYKVSEYLFLNILYWICYYFIKFCFYYPIKYCLYYPIKWVVVKVIDIFKNKETIKKS